MRGIRGAANSEIGIGNREREKGGPEEAYELDSAWSWPREATLSRKEKNGKRAKGTSRIGCAGKENAEGQRPVQNEKEKEMERGEKGGRKRKRDKEEKGRGKRKSSKRGGRKRGETKKIRSGTEANKMRMGRNEAKRGEEVKNYRGTRENAKCTGEEKK